MSDNEAGGDSEQGQPAEGGQTKLTVYWWVLAYGLRCDKVPISVAQGRQQRLPPDTHPIKHSGTLTAGTPIEN